MKGIEPDVVRFFVGFCRNRVCLPLITVDTGLQGTKAQGCRGMSHAPEQVSLRSSMQHSINAPIYVRKSVDVRRERNWRRGILGERTSGAQHKSRGLPFCGGCNDGKIANSNS